MQPRPVVRSPVERHVRCPTCEPAAELVVVARQESLNRRPVGNERANRSRQRVTKRACLRNRHRTWCERARKKVHASQAGPAGRQAVLLIKEMRAVQVRRQCAGSGRCNKVGRWRVRVRQ